MARRVPFHLGRCSRRLTQRFLARLSQVSVGMTERRTLSVQDTRGIRGLSSHTRRRSFSCIMLADVIRASLLRFEKMAVGKVTSAPIAISAMPPLHACEGASFNQKHVAAEGVRGGCSRAAAANLRKRKTFSKRKKSPHLMLKPFLWASRFGSRLGYC
mmetsp:Transcript_21993/g.51590  ORF Transcript_21993/g.51590 Transcript_21993/m.51590 type:complete len:158 (+) Transcript_21993:203-676(+)